VVIAFGVAHKAQVQILLLYRFGMNDNPENVSNLAVEITIFHYFLLKQTYFTFLKSL